MTQVFAGAGMSYDGFDSGHVPTAVPWGTGNSGAPISGGVAHGELTLTTAGSPWKAIGLTGVGSGIDITNLQQPSWPLTLLAFDNNGHQIASETLTFHATPACIALSDIEAAFNSAVLFLGFKSDVPIYSVSTIGSDPYVSWDNLTFTPVHEPSSVLLRVADALASFTVVRPQRPHSPRLRLGRQCVPQR